MKAKTLVLDSATSDMAPRFLVHSSPWRANLTLEWLSAYTTQQLDSLKNPDRIHAEGPVCAHGAD